MSCRDCAPAHQVLEAARPAAPPDSPESQAENGRKPPLSDDVVLPQEFHFELVGSVHDFLHQTGPQLGEQLPPLVLPLYARFSVAQSLNDTYTAGPVAGSVPHAGCGPLVPVNLRLQLAQLFPANGPRPPAHYRSIPLANYRQN